MRKIASWLFAAILGCILNNTALANTFAGGIPKEVPYTYEGVTYDKVIVFSRGSYDVCNDTIAAYFVSSEMYSSGYPATQWYSLFHVENIPFLLAGPDGTHAAIFFAEDNLNGVCYWPGDAIPEVTTTGIRSWNLRPDKAEAIHNHIFPLHMRSFDSGAQNWSAYFLPYTFTGEYADWGTWYESTEGSQSYLWFPIPKDNNGNSYNPSTAPISAVMDHSMTMPYTEDGMVLAFTGARGEKVYGYKQGCYTRGFGGIFDFPQINYVGTSETGGKYYLCYDGHPGYDYPFAKNTPIHSSSAGILCVATSQTTPNGGLWRNPEYCPLAKAGTTTWKDYHTFYIIHKSLLFDGVVNDYMTVYLHSNSLEPSVEAAIRSNGYIAVTSGKHVAYVGGYGPNGAKTYGYHLHFESYRLKTSSGKWIRLDPYGGDGLSTGLWGNEGN